MRSRPLDEELHTFGCELMQAMFFLLGFHMHIVM